MAVWMHRVNPSNDNNWVITSLDEELISFGAVIATGIQMQIVKGKNVVSTGMLFERNFFVFVISTPWSFIKACEEDLLDLT